MNHQFSSSNAASTMSRPCDSDGTGIDTAHPEPASERSGRAKKGAWILLLSALLGVFTVVAGPAAPASAGAYGCSYFGGLSYGGPAPVYNGSYCADLQGSGTYVNGVLGRHSNLGRLCNTQITAEFFDQYGRWYRTFTSGTAWGCRNVGSHWIGLGYRAQRGRMCSTLRSNGIRVTSVCHSIY